MSVGGETVSGTGGRARQPLEFRGPESMRPIQHLFDPSRPFVFFHAGVYSNWHKAAMVIDNTNYNTVEQFMMAEKARTFEDWPTRKKILVEVGGLVPKK